MAGEVTPTQEEFLKKVAEWAAKKGRQPNTIEAKQIWADMVTAGSTMTDAQRKNQEKIDKQPLTDAGLSSLAQQLVLQSQSGVPVEQQAAIIRTVKADVKNLIDPITGKAVKEISYSKTPGTYNYSGMNLVDENGNITQSTSTDNSQNSAANPLFQKMKVDGKLPQFLQALKDSGHYWGKSPSTMALAGEGLSNADYVAIDSFINSANLARYTPEGYLAVMLKNPGAYKTAGGGSGSSAAYPNELDTARTLRQEAFATLGRPLSPAEIKAAVRFVNSAYMSASGSGGEQAPSLQSAAEAAIAKTSGEEAAVYGLSMALDRIFKGQGSV